MGISDGPKTRGADQFEFVFQFTFPDGKPGPIVYDTLTDAENLLWRWDALLKACGVTIPKGQSYSFDRGQAESMGGTFVDVYGLRGWAELFLDTYVNKDTKRETKRMKIATYLTNKPLLPRDPSVKEPVEETQSNDAF